MGGVSLVNKSGEIGVFAAAYLRRSVDEIKRQSDPKPGGCDAIVINSLAAVED